MKSVFHKTPGLDLINICDTLFPKAHVLITKNMATSSENKQGLQIKCESILEMETHLSFTDMRRIPILTSLK